MLTLVNVSKYYYSNNSVTCALRNINLTFDIGEFVSITGESGSGKTTLLNILSGFDSYEEGEIYFNGKETSYFDKNDWEEYREKEISFIFQNYGLIESYSVLENVMVAFMIQGTPYKESKTKAKELLSFVGLDKLLKRKAIKLSGGQKQRLAIARALAKNTKIIVCDEPTGNLDSENGDMILALLKKISKDRLVIVVTHNQGQIEPFATRKIRLHDGSVVLDEYVSHPQSTEELDIVNHKVSNFKKALNFSFWNIKSQPKRTFLLSMLSILSAFSSFVFYGNFKSNIDDSKTRIIDDSIFVNHDETRMLVKNSDSSIVSDQDYANCKIDNVTSIEPYDYITDINYYRPNEGYRMKYSGGTISGGPNSGQVVDSSSYILIDETMFMRSSYALSDSDLKIGRLPTNEFEMVVYSSNLSLLNTQEKVFFKNSTKWGIDTYFQYDIKIVGILKEKQKQAFFSNDICNLLNMTQYDIKARINFREKRYNYFSSKMLQFSYVAIDERLTGYQVSLDKNSYSTLKEAYDYESKINFFINNQNYIKDVKFVMDSSLLFEGPEIAIGISKDFFNELYQETNINNQFAIYLTDLAYYDDVSTKLMNMDYISLSCYKASLTDYDTSKVIIRYVNLGISIFALFIINLLVILLGYQTLKFKKGDFITLKMLGLKNKLCSLSIYFELLIYGLVSNLLLLGTCVTIKKTCRAALLKNLFKYIRFYDYIIVFFISMLVLLFIGRKFSKFLEKKVKVTSLKED